MTREELETQVNAIYKKFDVEAGPDTSAKTTPKTYTRPSEEALRARAEADLIRRGDLLRREEIGRKADEALARIEGEQTAADAQLTARIAAIRSEYADIKKRSADSALRRGFARSSAEMLAQTRIALAEAAAVEAATDAREQRRAALDAEKTSVEETRAKELADDRIAYATKLDARIAELTAECDAAENAVLEYNNTLAFAAAKDLRTASAFEADHLEAARTYAEHMRERELYVVAVEYLNGLPAGDAVKALDTDPIFRNILSDYDRSVLRNIYLARQ